MMTKLKQFQFKIDDLFTAANGDVDLKRNDIDNAGMPVITSGVQNNGILGLSSKAAKIIEKNTITVDMFGNAYYRDFNYKMVTHARVFALLPKSNVVMNRETGLYLSTCIQKLQYKFSYNNMCSFNKLKGEYITLPVSNSNNINWQFMEDFIQELEAERIQELEAYLLATGLTNYHIKGLTLESRTWGTFKNDDLFEKCSLKRLKKTFDKKNDLSTTRTKEYNLPLVNAKAGNNGIMYYGRECDWESEELTLDVVSNGAISTGMVYAQPQRTGTLWDAYQIRLKDRVPTYRQLLFLQRCLQTNIQLKFNYYNKATWEKVKHETIDLPLKNSSDSDHYSKSDIDWQFMEDFICDLEAERIQNLKAEFIQEQEAYLIASGLTNCHLKI